MTVVFSQAHEIAPVLVRGHGQGRLAPGDYALRFHDTGAGRWGCSVADEKLHSLEEVKFSVGEGEGEGEDLVEFRSQGRVCFQWANCSVSCEWVGFLLDFAF